MQVAVIYSPTMKASDNRVEQVESVLALESCNSQYWERAGL